MTKKIKTGHIIGGLVALGGLIYALTRPPAPPADLVLDLPLWSPELKGDTFYSKDPYRHLIIVSGALWTPDGRLFDGFSDVIVIPHHASLEAASMTWMFLFKHNYSSFPLDNVKGLLWKAVDTGYARSFSSFLSVHGKIVIEVGNGAGNGWAYQFTTPATYQDNDFHLVVVTKAYGAGGDTFQTIIDNVLLDETVSGDNGYVSPYPMEFGRASTLSLAARYLNGICNVIIVYERGLTLPEIASGRLATK